MDDFSGGIGHLRTDIRESLGTCWDNLGGVDIRRPRRIILPPKKAATLALTSPTLQLRERLPSRPFATSSLGFTGAEDGWLFFGFGNKLYNVDKARTAVNVSDTLTGGNMISHVEEFNEYNTSNRYLYYCGEGTGGTTKLRRSTDPFNGSWADASSKIIEDFIVFSDVILATTPIAKIVYSKNGALWSDDPTVDSQPLWQSGVGRVMFIGVALGPWGGPGIYFINQGKLYVIDFWSRTAYPIQMGSQKIFTGCVWQGLIYVTDGFSVWQVDPVGREIVRDVSPHNRWGNPLSLTGGGIRYLYGGEKYLYAVHTSTVFLGSAPLGRILAYNGAGWTPITPEIADCAPLYCMIDYLPHINLPSDPRHLWMPFSNTVNGTTISAAHWHLPQGGEAPTQGIDKFEDGPLAFVTGWIDGGFHEVDGTAFRVEIDSHALTATETITVEYQIEVDGTQPNDLTAWTQLVNSGNGAMIFDSNDDIGYFSSANPLKGSKFRRIRFRIILDRGSTDTVSPELVALVFVYDKKPKLRMSWAFRIDVDRMIAEGMLVDGIPATYNNVFEKLISLWNTYPLLTLDVPSVASGSDARQVRISNFPMTFDDFQTALTGRGHIDVTCLETVNTA